MEAAAIRALRVSLDGDLVTSDDAGYDEGRRIFNAMIDRRPAAIAYCSTLDDVIASVQAGADSASALAIRAGGHSVAGSSVCDDGLVIDVRRLNDVSVDPVARTVRVGGGAIWAELDAATQEHGLATTGGRVSTTGVAGLTLGGGSGWLERSLGLACDNLIAVELVTAAGEIVRASTDEHSELFWALHGGGGNFGVATAFEFALSPVGPELFGGLIVYDPVHAPVVARAFRDFMLEAPDAAGFGLAFITGPPEEFIPPEWQGKLLFGIAGCWNGPIEEGERMLRPLFDLAEPVADLFGPIPYTAFQSMIDDPPGLRNWWTAEYLAELSDQAIDDFIAYSAEMPLGFTQALLLPWGGAVARAEDTPLAKREAAYVLHPFCVWEGTERDEEHIAWGKSCRQIFEPHTTGGVYLNFVGDEGEERVRAAFGDEGYQRLASVKAEYDPANLFRLNQNIKPRREIAR